MHDKKNLSHQTKMKEKCEATIKKLEEIVKENTKVLLIVGNGISNEELYTSNIVTNFLNDFKKSDPKTFDDVTEIIKDLSKAFGDAQMPPDYDMAKFLEGLNSIKEVREKFIDYLIEKCCKAQPNEKHFALLSFCSILNKIPSKESKEIIPIIFTTNYDNLIEKFYNKRKQFIKDTYSSLYNDVGKLEELIGEKGYIEDNMLVPGYYLDLEAEDMEIRQRQEILSIIPIHNSIRTTKCPNITCNQTLLSEAVGLGKKFCIYCGEELEEIIIPTEEKRTDVVLLDLLEEQAKKANAIVFIGYSFSDKYLINRIKHGIEDSKNKKIILNFCTTPLPDNLKSVVKNDNLFDIIYDLPKSLYYANSKFTKKNELINLFCKICEKEPPDLPTSS